MDKQTIIDQLIKLNIPHNPADHWKTLQKLLGEVRNVSEVSGLEKIYHVPAASFDDVQTVETGNGKQYVVEKEPTRKDERDSVMTELRDSLKVTQDRAEALHEKYKGNNPSLSRIARNVGITCQRQIKALR